MEVSESDSRPRGVKRRRHYCEHCEGYLSKSTYYRHRSKYYNIATGKWIKVSDITNPNSSSSADDEDSSSSLEVTFDDNLVYASSMVSERYASDFARVSSLPHSQSSPSSSAECRTLPIESKYIISTINYYKYMPMFAPRLKFTLLALIATLKWAMAITGEPSTPGLETLIL